ncbi:MAG: glycoside hydrolase domain-containing protein [Planctomycetota bacterium]
MLFYGHRIVILSVLMVVGAGAVEIPYGVVRQPWDIHLGHHRAWIHVVQPADAVRVSLPWRRRDNDAGSKNVIIVDVATGERIRNIARIEVTREYGDLVFQPKTAPGEYYVYYLPYVVQMNYGGYGGGYLPVENTADAQWIKRHNLTLAELGQGKWRNLPEASVLEFQARTAFDSFYPMEVVATKREVARFLAVHQAEPYLLFVEDRRYPIRMSEDLPKRWIDSSSGKAFSGEVQRNEFYALQIGVYASKQTLEDLTVAFSDLRPEKAGKPIPATALRCFNLGGTDTNGQHFRKAVSVAQGKIQPLWIGVDVAGDTEPALYRGTITIHPRNAPPAEVAIALTIRSEALADRGDSEPWRHSRLRWLDSTIAIDDEVVAPYTPLVVDGRTIRCLNREVRFGDDGLPARILSGAQEILAQPMRFIIEADSGPLRLAGGVPKISKQTPGTVVWDSQAAGGPVSLNCRARMEFDGHLQYELTLKANQPVHLKDSRLELPFEREAAAYMMGMGRPGGSRPQEYTWKWAGPQDSFWIGNVHAGLHCKLRGATYCGPLLNLYHPAPPPSWHNGGKGGCTVSEMNGSPVLVRAYGGERTLAAGESIVFEFALLITPVKHLDTARHFRERYYHHFPPPAPDELTASKVNVINVHHANEVNPYINYPFAAVPQMSAFVKTWQERGMKVKIYYTLRELSNYVTELWALRSLGTEVLAGGGGGGFPWLREHLAANYTPQWFQPYPDGTADAAILNSGESRWYNYYIEGLAWLAQNVHIDGLYLDDVSYDRRILKRMRKVLDRNRPGSMIDLHSNTAFSIGPANQYAEFFPYVDRLWFGESFNYNAMSPDTWLVEVSGIPFGLMGDMLQGGGNPWRGMVYGMTNRLPWGTAGVSCDPRAIWKVWDDFGIAEAKMIGYWEKNCPVRTDNSNVLATAYVKKGRTLVSIASWVPKLVECRLAIDWRALGLDPQKAVIVAPEVAGFQPARRWQTGNAIPVAPTKGWLLLIDEAEGKD